MKRLLCCLLTLIIIFTAAGCSTIRTDVTSYGKSVHSPTPPESVRVLHEYPPQDFVRIGEVELVDDTYGMEHALVQKQRLKKAAASIGGEAVVVRSDTALGRQNERRVSVNSFYDPQQGFRADASSEEPHDYGRRLVAVVIRFGK